MVKPIKIGDYTIDSRKFPPFIVAEMSGNHNQSLKTALSIVDAASWAGVNAVKLQTYTADTLTINAEEDEFFINDPESLWKGKSLYELYQDAYTPWEWHEPIIKRCRERGLIAFSTPFDESAVDFLETLDIPAYKIASFENNHLPLIKKAASTGKPLIVSTGTANLYELAEAVETARKAGCNEIILLKCTSAYPASPEEINLLTIPHLRDLYGTPVGLSDHTLGIGVSIASISLGSVLIEKHFTTSRACGGVDSAFSMEPEEMKFLVEETKKAWHALGKVNYEPTKKEKISMKFKRSLYAVQDIAKGEKFTEDNIRVIRPNKGLPPKYIEVFLGKEASKSIKRGTPLKWEYI